MLTRVTSRLVSAGLKGNEDVPKPLEGEIVFFGTSLQLGCIFLSTLQSLRYWIGSMLRCTI
jgi:hypothetical protein